MANGDNLPYQTLDVVPFTPITSEWGDGIGSDILALAAGTGLDNGAVDTIQLGDGAVTSAKLGSDVENWRLLEDVTQSVAGTMTFGSLQAHARYRMVLDLSVTANGNVWVQFNGDTGNNYSSYRVINGTGSANNTIAGGLIATGSTGRLISEISIFNNTVGKVGALYKSAMEIDSSLATAINNIDGAFKWTSAAQITQIHLFNGGGDISTGSRVRIYGLVE